jgi:CubicO group peptidase (beta-lactamase class C family)
MLFSLKQIPRLLAAGFLALALIANGARADDAGDITQDLRIVPPDGPAATLSLAEAMDALHVPSVGVALIRNGEIAWSRTFGMNPEGDPIYQAASLSKFVAAVVAMKLVDDGVLSLDAPVDTKLRMWRASWPPYTDNHPVTLRWLLSMRAGASVPGFMGYDRGAPLPSLSEILNGTPPANSQPVTIISTPGEVYAYSGGGYEVVEALIEDATTKSFAEVAKESVFSPLGMASSSFTEPLPASRVATGHMGDGTELPGGWRVMPELAAAGLWSTPQDLARLLVSIVDGYHGRAGAILSKVMVDEMLTPQGDGPYGLGAAISGQGQDVVLMKRGQNVGYQGYLILFPAMGDGMVVMTGSNNGTVLAESLIRRAAEIYAWPAIEHLQD